MHLKVLIEINASCIGLRLSFNGSAAQFVHPEANLMMDLPNTIIQVWRKNDISKSYSFG